MLTISRQLPLLLLHQLRQPLLQRQLQRPRRSPAAQRCLLLTATYSEDTNSVRTALSYSRPLRLTTQVSPQLYGATSTAVNTLRKTLLLLQLPGGTTTTTRLI